MYQRHVKLNNRDEREAFDVPMLQPLGDKKFWDFQVFPRAYKSWSKMNKKDKIVAGILGSIHALALLAPFTYSPGAVGWAFWSYMITLQGITLSYHR
jgi:hypothetical protein